MRKFIIAALLLAAAPATAEKAAAAFNAGRFAEAAAAGRAEGTPASLLLAGRANAIQAAYFTTDKARAQALLEAAEDDLKAVIRRDPANLDATLQMAITVGYAAKLQRAPGLAKQARQGFEYVLARRPNDPHALAAMGGWHGESVATLGGFLAGTVLGAKKSEAVKYFDRALAVAGTDPIVPTFYASTLLALDADNAPKAKALLERAAAGKAADGYAALLRAHAREILSVLAKGDVKAARATAARLGPLGTVK